MEHFGLFLWHFTTLCIVLHILLLSVQNGVSVSAFVCVSLKSLCHVLRLYHGIGRRLLVCIQLFKNILGVCSLLMKVKGINYRCLWRNMWRKKLHNIGIFGNLLSTLILMHLIVNSLPVLQSLLYFIVLSHQISIVLFSV